MLYFIIIKRVNISTFSIKNAHQRPPKQMITEIGSKGVKKIVTRTKLLVLAIKLAMSSEGPSYNLNHLFKLKCN